MDEPDQSNPRVLVLVPTFNGAALLDEVLSSLAGQTYADHAVLVIDDASTDGSAALLAERWPQVTVLRNPVNRGFAGSVNRGLLLAGAELIGLVNSDVTLAPDWLELLVRTLDDHPEAASATGKGLIRGDPERLDGAGNQMRWSGGATRRGYNELDHGQFDEPGEVISACAGYALYRASAFAAIGGFDDALTAYYEDVDWGLRAQLAGFTCRYEPRAVACHAGGASYGADEHTIRLEHRNQLVVVLKCYPAAALIRHAPQIAIGQLVLLARGLPDGNARIHLRALADVLIMVPQILRGRGAVARSRRVGSERLDDVMTPERYWPWRGRRS
jgi:GT2 family glycosyltransferase